MYEKSVRSKYFPHQIQSCWYSKTTDIVKEISDYIDQNPCEYSPFIKNPGKLVGRQVNHRFELQNQSFQWFTGTRFGL